MNGPTQREQAELLALNLIKAIGGLFTYVPSYIVSLLTAVLSDVYLTTFALAGVAAGLASTWAVGVATFFVIYSVARVWGNHTNAIVQAGREVSGGIQISAERLDNPRYVAFPEQENDPPPGP